MNPLARLISAYAPHDGSFDLRIQGLQAGRHSETTDYVRSMRMPSLCIVAQGSKSIMVGQEVYEYDATRLIAVSVALPIAVRITQASPSAPYLAIMLELDPQRMSELVLKAYPHGLPPVQNRHPAYVTGADAAIVSAATRLLECLATPGDIELIAPLVVDEILIRLLRSPIGMNIAEMGLADSGVSRVSKAVSWLRDNFAQPMRVEDLAELVHMSPSSFYAHFKAVTSLSPLQYQKTLRLQEARRLMLSTMMDVSSAGQQVGYVSASQFSRDYSRLFGSPPTRDIANLRQAPVQVAVM